MISGFGTDFQNRILESFPESGSGIEFYYKALGPFGIRFRKAIGFQNMSFGIRFRKAMVPEREFRNHASESN